MPWAVGYRCCFWPGLQPNLVFQVGSLGPFRLYASTALHLARLFKLPWIGVILVRSLSARIAMWKYADTLAYVSRPCVVDQRKICG